MGLFLPHVLYTVWCLSKSYAHNNNCKKQLVKKKKKNKQNKSTTIEELMLELADLMPDCWLEVSLHPDGPVTGQLSQGFPWFSFVQEQMLS
jgi:hypothetical protein